MRLLLSRLLHSTIRNLRVARFAWIDCLTFYLFLLIIAVFFVCTTSNLNLSSLTFWLLTMNFLLFFFCCSDTIGFRSLVISAPWFQPNCKRFADQCRRPTILNERRERKTISTTRFNANPCSAYVSGNESPSDWTGHNHDDDLIESFWELKKERKKTSIGNCEIWH